MTSPAEFHSLGELHYAKQVSRLANFLRVSQGKCRFFSSQLEEEVPQSLLRQEGLIKGQHYRVIGGATPVNRRIANRPIYTTQMGE